MKKTLLVAIVFLFLITELQSQAIKSPDEFLGYELGTQFTYYYKAVEYFKYISDISPLAEYKEYGTTNEGRVLGACFISSEENLANLEEYRKNNLIKAGFMQGTFTGKQLPFVWLAYNVHGNEAVGMEAAMKTLYTLVTGSYPEVTEYLKSCIIIIDPCQNPDGRDLYTNRYRSTQNSILTADRMSWEHNQGWPGARTNHYMFDLNRDWTWQTQKETMERLAFYNQYMPQVHADFHEMGPENTFFFAPAADPWNGILTPWQHTFHKLMGSGNADLFNAKFRMYFTRESFDLFYPGFGDTWPSFNGAIGFTYEQGGGGPSGIAYKQDSGDTLTLKSRIEGHFTASMATIKVSYENREKLIQEYNKFFEESVKNPQFQYKSVIIKGSNEKSDVHSLLDLLDRNQIRYSYAGTTGKKYKGFDYTANKDGEMTIEKGDILISAYQPQSHFIQALFEPDTKASDSITYDLTAWSLPYIYNLKSFALNDKVPSDTAKVVFKKIVNEIPATKPYAYVANFTGFDEHRLIANLFLKKIKVRYSLKPFNLNGTTYNRGSLIIARGDNMLIEASFDRKVIEAANECQVKLVAANTGFVETGKDFGSDNTPLVKKKSVALLCGDGTQQSSVGEIWYFFEKELNYPVSLINMNYREDRIDFRNYDVLILTSGQYTKLKDTIVDFVRRGGRVIAIENAVSIFSSNKNTALAKAIELRTTEMKAIEKKTKSDDTTLLKKYEYANEYRYMLNDRSVGGIYRVKLDETNPAVFGLGKEWFVLKTSPGYPFLATGDNIGYILEKDPVSGFAGSKFRKEIKNTIVIGSEKIGAGEVFYITDNPYFRAFWKSGRILLGNMILK
jgi:hypothetical protein